MNSCYVNIRNKSSSKQVVEGARGKAYQKQCPAQSRQQCKVPDKTQKSIWPSRIGTSTMKAGADTQALQQNPASTAESPRCPTLIHLGVTPTAWLPQPDMLFLHPLHEETRVPRRPRLSSTLYPRPGELPGALAVSPHALGSGDAQCSGSQSAQPESRVWKGPQVPRWSATSLS